MILAIHCIARQTLINTIMQQQTNRRWMDAEKEGFCLLGIFFFYLGKCCLYPSFMKVVFQSPVMLKFISLCVDISLCDVKS